ncbi:hypothetical protein I4U23_017416 [Adineta vaga]|nr:hypothetical protein I4U23_017416 [Adineta vaga]
MFIKLIIYFSLIYLTYSDQNITANIGQDITLSCFYENQSQIDQLSFMHQTTGDILSLGLELFLDDSVANQHMKLIQFSSNRLDLKIFSVNQNDSGLYTCMFNDEKLSSYLLEIFIPPRFLSFFPLEASVSYPEGSSINFSCHAYAFPPANITWIYRNQNKQFKNIQSGDEIYIPSVEPLDSGSYECIASNGYHQAISRAFYVTVQYPPHVTIDKFIDLNQRPIQFKCEICSVPLSHIEWFRNGKNIIDEQHFLIKTNSLQTENKDCLTTTLTFQDPIYEKFGRYECRAENILGHYSDHIDYQSKTVPIPKLRNEQSALLILPNKTIEFPNSSSCSIQLNSSFILSIIFIFFNSYLLL